MTRYKLLKCYPNHKIGDIAKKPDTGFYWENEEDSDNIPPQFYPGNAPGWWQKVEEEKSLEDYEKLIQVTGSLERQVIKMYPRIYWTEVLRVIAEDLNKDTTVTGTYIISKMRDGVIHSLNLGFCLQGGIYFRDYQTCQKAIDLLGENIKYLFND